MLRKGDATEHANKMIERLPLKITKKLLITINMKMMRYSIRNDFRNLCYNTNDYYQYINEMV